MLVGYRCVDCPRYWLLPVTRLIHVYVAFCTLHFARCYPRLRDTRVTTLLLRITHIATRLFVDSPVYRYRIAFYRFTTAYPFTLPRLILCGCVLRCYTCVCSAFTFVRLFDCCTFTRFVTFTPARCVDFGSVLLVGC